MSDEQAPQPKAEGCPECGCPDDWAGASWCPNCGYYPAIKQQVDVAQPAYEEQEFENWWEVIPSWMWVIVAGIGCLFVISIAVRVMFAESPVLVLWTAAQMGIGLIALGTAHVMAYFYGVGKTDKLGPLDMFMRPIATWQPVFRDLPGSSNLVCTLACSIAALAFGFFIVDGVDYVAIMQADAKERKLAQAEQAAKDAAEGKKKTSAMGYLIKGATAVAQTKQTMNPTPAGPPPASLEDALAEFTGAAPITGDGTLGPLSQGGTGTCGFGDPMTGLTGDGGIDVNAYLQQQQSIANGTGGWTTGPGAMGTSASGTQNSAPGGTEGEVRRGPDRGVTNSNARNVRLPSNSKPDSHPSTSPVSTTASAATGASGGFTESPAEDPPLPAMEVECLVLGYTTSVGGEIRSLLLAAAPDRELLRFVAKVPVENVNAEVLEEMSAHFRKIPQRRCLVRCPYGGNWISPEIFCIVAYDGWTADRRLNDPRVLRLVHSEQPQAMSLPN